MSRNLKRVPLDFSHPIGKLWDGYLNPHYQPCPEEAKGNCHSGATSAGRWLDSIVRLIGLIGEEATQSGPEWEERHRKNRRIYPHPYLESFEQAPRTSSGRLAPLTSELASFVHGLAGGTTGMFGSGSEWQIQKKLRAAAGVDNEKWGVCPACEGHGQNPATRAAYDAWVPVQPPTGPGFQLWEDTSEGSPCSPVFASLDELCAWAEKNATTFGSHKTSAAEWKRMLDGGFVCHGIRMTASTGPSVTPDPGLDYYLDLPFHVVAELRQALDAAATQYGAAGRVTVDASVLRELVEALEGMADEAHDYDTLSDAKAERIRKVLDEHQAKYPRTDAVSESQADAVKEVCTAVDNLLDDL